MSHQNKVNKAFTLSEVLITIGIIGVIAALVIPPLIKNTRDAELKTAFKKSYSNLAQAYNSLVTQNGGLPYYCYYNNDFSGNTGECSLFWPNIKEKLKIIRAYKSNVGYDGVNIPNYKTRDEVIAGGGSAPNSNCSGTTSKNKEVWYLADGSMLLSYAGTIEGAQLFILDTNGVKKPNKWGYDVFMLDFKNMSDAIQKIRIEDDICSTVEKGGYRINDILMNQ